MTGEGDDRATIPPAVRSQRRRGGHRRRGRAARAVAVAGLVALVAGIVVAVVDLTDGDPPALTPPDAVTFTRRALSAAGVAGAVVDPAPRPGRFTPEGSDPVEVWIVPVDVEGQHIELYVPRRGDRAVNLDDEIAPGQFLLSDGQFDALKRFRLDLHQERLRQRQVVPGAVAGILVLLTGTWLFMTVRSPRR